MVAEISANFGDKEMIDDVLTSQKHIADLYNSCALECASDGLKETFMTILGEEHQIQMDIYKEMSKRGWYPTKAAEKKDIQQVLDQYQNGNS